MKHRMWNRITRQLPLRWTVGALVISALVATLGATGCKGADFDGDEIGADWPVCMLSASDADAYARWRRAQTGRLVRLPTSDEWEVAAGGGDGRVFPWGDGFDPSLCRMLTSAPRAGPCPIGSYPRDRSPFGVLDAAGLVREHTSTEIDGQRVVRGGAWPAAPVQCRIGRRSLLGPDETYVTFGFRLAHDV